MEETQEFTTGPGDLLISVHLTYKGPDAVARTELTIKDTVISFYADPVFNGRTVTLFDGEDNHTMQVLPEVAGVDDFYLSRIVSDVEQMFVERLRFLDEVELLVVP